MAKQTERKQSRPSRWRVGVPLVCLLAGLLLGATHGVSRGGEIRRSDAPRLVDLVRREQSEVDRLNAERDRLANTIDATVNPSGNLCKNTATKITAPSHDEIKKPAAIATPSKNA